MQNVLLVQGGDGFDLQIQTAQFTADTKICFEAEDLKAAVLEETLFSPSFFSQTLVIIQNAQELSDKALELVIAFAKRPTPKVSLVVHSNGTTELAKHLPVVVINEVKPWEKQAHITQWILSYVKAQ